MSSAERLVTQEGGVMRCFKEVLVAWPYLIAALILGSPAWASADTHIVRPGESIQAAVDAASPGDTVVVKSGTYRESVTIHTHGLTLRAQGRVTLKPPPGGSSDCYLPDHDVGICVAPADMGTGGYTARVRDVTITGFRVVGFEGEGIFGFHTKDLKVSHVVAIDNAAYGIASFDGVGTSLTHNAVTGSQDAGLYIGDSLEADAVVSHNRVWNNAFGILSRHSQKVVVSDNAAWGNCLGIFLLADGQAGGSGQTAVLGNKVVGNNDVCTQFAAVGFLPILGGGGIVLAGSQHNAILRNVVRNNRGDTLFSGGIVVIATPKPNTDGSFDASTNNLVILNRLHDNEPADLVNDDASSPNLIVANRCQTSTPDGLCGG
jgi:Periplasmic copper-binding protein (NosD)